MYFYKYSVNNVCTQTNLKCELDLHNNITYRLDDGVLTFPNYSLALWLVHHIELKNCNTLNDIQNKWNEYHEIITNNELLMYKDNYIIYDRISSIILFSRDNDTVLVIPSFSSEISLDELSKAIDVTKYRLTISYLVENNIFINFSELIKKYSDDFFDFIKYLPNLIQYDIDIEDDIIEIIYNQTKNNIILEYILYDANSN